MQPTANETVTTDDGEQALRLRGARILLTEDNEINQQIAVELLEGTGATVKVANNGREAVDILSNGPQPPPFDVVLMDLQMPEMDGYQATAKLRSDARFAALPIIAMTAHATIEEKPALSRRRDERSYLEANRSQCAVRNRGAVLSVRPGNVGICSRHCRNLGPGCEDGRRSHGGVAR